MDDLAEAERALRKAVACLSPDAPYGSGVLANAAAALKQRYLTTGDREALAEALALAREAVARSPHQERADHLHALAQHLQLLTEDVQDWDAVAEAVELCREALALTPADHPKHAERLARLAVMLGKLGESRDDPEAFRESVDLLRQSLLRTPADDPYRVHRLGALGNALQRLSSWSGDTALLEEAIGCLRQAAAELPDHEDGRGSYSFDLAICLHHRFLQTGDRASHAEALDLARNAMRSSPADSVAKGVRAEFLSVVLQNQFGLTGDRDVVHEAVAAGREAVALAAQGSLTHTKRLNTLATTLLGGYHCDGDAADLNEALRLLEQALDMTPFDDPSHARMLRSLGEAWRAMARHTGDPNALHQAVVALGRAVRAAQSQPYAHATHQVGHGDVLRDLYEAEGDPGVLRAAANAYQLAARSTSFPPLQRALAACSWAACLEMTDGPGAALRGLELAIELLPQVAPRRLSRSDQERGLARLNGLASAAAWCAINTGDTERAVQLLEQGRGVLLGQMLEGRGELAELRAAYPVAADYLIELRERMESLAPPEELSATPSPWPRTAEMSDERHALATRWDEQIAYIRTLRGFEEFLAGPTRDSLLECAEEGPVCLLYDGPDRGDALILCEGQVIHVPLPALTQAALEHRVTRFHDALRASRTPGEEEGAGQVIDETLGWLWDCAAGPVLDRIGLLGPPAGEWPRMWWSPSGALSSLPLHAAGHHAEHSTPRPRSVLDRVVSSYTPTVRALRYARSRDRASPRQTDLLAVTMRHTPGAGTLRRADREGQTLRKLLPAKVLSGPEATYEAVRTALPHHSYVHFACHGVSVPGEPSTSRLLLHDHERQPLTLLDVSRLDLSEARMAMLSACETSQGSAHLADEAIHITSAFQIAGYPHVIGTLWPVHDSVAARVTEAVYRDLRGEREASVPGLDTARAAGALHRAVLECRELYRKSPSLWATHVHAGA
ncbi:CHAT domain-containing protein [Streptomyces sp. HC44]|uniref:CHAT domain-containing protein n=1 Tax=Streptomyces scabichelini TaxID=2711217 RepID=A0A6G4VDZ4_9ACTN|nr:CHAT domain-containing protein [Streptomyces scabichelini]NGO12115.1 CHAT domain-containing protein [Streptomyces scabichelini]